MNTEVQIVRTLRNIFDPEIPVNIYDLGLIYEVELKDAGEVRIVMTLTAPGCPMAEELMQEVKDRVLEIKEVEKLDLKLTFNPPWHRDMMTEEARLELGFL